MVFYFKPMSQFKNLETSLWRPADLQIFENGLAKTRESKVIFQYQF